MCDSTNYTIKNKTSKKRTTSLQGTNGPSPKCPLFGGFTVCVQPLVCVIYDPQQLDMCSKLPATFALFPVLSLGYPNAQLTDYWMAMPTGNGENPQVYGQ